MKTQTVQRVYIEKPIRGSTRISNGTGYYSESWTVEEAGSIQKDLAGREYYELLLSREVAEPAAPMPPQIAEIPEQTQTT